MTATYCLGPFAKRLRALPWSQWRGEIEALPETCAHGCGANCREVCARYARMQWRVSKALQVAKEHKGAKR